MASRWLIVLASGVGYAGLGVMLEFVALSWFVFSACIGVVRGGFDALDARASFVARWMSWWLLDGYVASS